MLRIKLFKTTFEQMVAAREGVIATLSDEAIGGLFHLAEIKAFEPVKIVDLLQEESLGLVEFYTTISAAKNKEGKAFFSKLVVFARPPVDGVLVGFGVDDMYYVLAAWEWGEYTSWDLKQDAYGDPLSFG